MPGRISNAISPIPFPRYAPPRNTGTSASVGSETGGLAREGGKFRRAATATKRGLLTSLAWLGAGGLGAVAGSSAGAAAGAMSGLVVCVVANGNLPFLDCLWYGAKIGSIVGVAAGIVLGIKKAFF